MYGGFISGFAMSSSNANSIFSAPVRQRLLEQLRHGFSPSTSWEQLGDRINIDQMFVLIDGILPFEACLYYQVLPLFVDDNQLNLGMVSPDDEVAFEYIRRIISYLNYSLVARSITSEAHQSVLTTYLSHSSKRPRRTPNPYRSTIRSKKEKSVDSGDRLTFLLDDSNPSEAETLDLSVPLPPLHCLLLFHPLFPPQLFLPQRLTRPSFNPLLPRRSLPQRSFHRCQRSILNPSTALARLIRWQAFRLTLCCKNFLPASSKAALGGCTLNVAIAKDAFCGVKMACCNL